MSSLIRYQVPGVSISDWLDSFYANSPFCKSNREISHNRWPDVDIVEEENHYRLHADMPGIDKTDIKVEIENGVLTLSGEKKVARKEEKAGSYYHYERSFGSFSRSFSLPEHIDANSIEAHYQNGVLQLSIKKTEAAKPKSIAVTVS